MDTSKNKKYGTREDVYKCIATHTAGGLTKNDIIEKKNGQHTIYISKKSVYIALIDRYPEHS